MAFDLSSPAAKLAFEMALRNRQAVEGAGQFDAESRQAVQEALNYGNDKLADYENIYQQYVGPAETQRRAQAEAFNTYLIGLPELLAQSARETRGGGGGGGGSAAYDTTNLSAYETPEQKLARLMGYIVPPARIPTTTRPAAQPRTTQTRPFTTADQRERQAGGRTITARRL